MAASGSRRIAAALVVAQFAACAPIRAGIAPNPIISAVPVIPSVCPTKSSSAALELALVWECRARERAIMEGAVRQENSQLREAAAGLDKSFREIRSEQQRRQELTTWLLIGGLLLAVAGAAVGLGFGAASN